MNGKDGMMVAISFAIINGVLLALCIAMVRWSLNWASNTARTVVLVIFGLGTLLFSYCTVAWSLMFFQA